MTPSLPVKGMPLYLQVRDEILRRISSGRLRIGSWLPNENELSQEMSVSIGTIRRAMGILEADNVVRREQGRGTRILDPASPVAASSFNNIRDAKGERTDGAVTRLAHEIIVAGKVERSRLKLNKGDPIIKETRTRSHESVCMLYEEIALAMTRLPGLRELPQRDYRLTPLAFEHGVLLGRSIEQISAIALEGAIASRFDVKPGSPGLKLDRVIYTKNNEPLQWRLAFAHFHLTSYIAETFVHASPSLIDEFLSARAAADAD